MFHILATPILKERRLCKQRGLGLGGVRFFFKKQTKFQPLQPFKLTKKINYSFFKGTNKNSEGLDSFHLGDNPFFICTSPPPPTHSPPLRMAGSWIGEFRFAFSKKATIFFYPVDNFFKHATKKSTHQSAPIKYWGFAAGSPLCSIFL